MRQTGRRFWANAVIPVYFGEITPQGAVTEYPIPVQSVPSDFVTGPDGNIWFTDPVDDSVGEITTAGVVTEYSAPTPSPSPVDIAAGPDGNMWFAEEPADKVGEVLLAQPPSAPTDLTTPSPLPPRPCPGTRSPTRPPTTSIAMESCSAPATPPPTPMRRRRRRPAPTTTTSPQWTAALSEDGTLPAAITDNGDGTATIASTGPAAGDAGAYAFIITAANGVLPQASQTFTLTVTS